MRDWVLDYYGRDHHQCAEARVSGHHAVPQFAPMNSSVFDAHHYDPATNRLTLRFKTGKVWQYDDVPMEKAVAFAGSASPGRYFADRIKGYYPGTEVA